MAKPVEPITVERVVNVVRSDDADWTRAEICKKLGRKKTSHMIRIIELAVLNGEINRGVCTPEKGQPFYIYSYLDWGTPF
jgi:response regulator of citrate/malate metabolism